MRTIASYGCADLMVQKKYDCKIERDGLGWYGWLAEVDGKGEVLDEIITRRYEKRHGAVVRLREICGMLGMEGEKVR